MRQKDRSTREILGWVWRGYLHRHLAVLCAAITLMILNGGTAGITAYLVKPVFDDVLVRGDRLAMYGVAAVVGVVFFVKALSGFGQRFLTNVVGQKVGAAMQRDMLAHMLSLDSAWFHGNSPGALIERLRGDTTSVQHVWNALISKVGRDIVALVSLFGVMLSINWTWALIAMAGGPLLILPLTHFNRQVRRKTRAARGAAGLL
ncbi:MAG: ABC transporter ATP-binding protein, partial [Alphaproteobacteria bacterium HGW-Alphaproteobacteria-2]